MKKLLVSLAICSTLPLCAATTAFGAQTGANYISVKGDVVFLRDADLTDPDVSFEVNYDTGWGASAAFGHDFGMVRAELEVAYRTNDLDEVSITALSPAARAEIAAHGINPNEIIGVGVPLDGDMTSLAFMVNGYYDFKNSSPVTPYLMGGIGFARDEVSITVAGLGTVDSDDTVFAYQVGAGVGFKVSNEITLDLAYRYFATADPDFDGLDGEYGSHNVTFGIRVCF